MTGPRHHSRGELPLRLIRKMVPVESHDIMNYRDLQPHLISILLAVLAIPLALLAGPLFAASLLALAAGSLYSTRRFQRKVREAEEEKGALARELARSQKLSMVNELSAGIAHEINNPLAIISQETQWIEHLLQGDSLKDLEGTSDCRESLAAISLQVERCKEIVVELRSLAAEMQPVVQTVDINELAGQITDLVDKEAAARNIRVTRVFQPHVPLISTDPPLLRQVILNLLANAAQAIEADGEIKIETAAGATWVEVSVQDNGNGILPEHLEKIFTPFFSTKPEGKGCGMGLAICRGIIERLGGSISVESRVGTGTTFTVRLPLEPRSKGAVR